MWTYSLYERELFDGGLERIAGVDEAGRGPLAGPVVAAAVVLPPGCVIPGMNDSKKLGSKARMKMASSIRDTALAVGIGIADHIEIDAVNILRASIIAMHRALDALPAPPELALVDGNQFHHAAIPFRTIVAGDACCFSIAAASIIAKVTRDGILDRLDETYPAYGFSRHKGYATAEHIEALRRHGPSPVHRRSFVVKQLTQQFEVFPRNEHEH